MNCEELRKYIRELCEEYGHSTITTAAVEDLELALLEAQIGSKAPELCDHPRHRNPGLITNCPECEAKF